MTEFKTFKIDDEYIEQNDIARRYLQNKLTPEETVEFEEYILDKPELLERLELDMVLVDTLPKIRDTKKKVTFWRTSLFYSMLTCSACMAIISVLIIKQADTQLQNYPSPNIVYLENYRSANTATFIDLSKDRSPIMVVDTSHFTEPRFDVLIQTTDGKTHKLISELLRNQSNEIVFTIDDKSLLSTDSTLIIKPSNSDKPALSFPVTSTFNN